MPTRRRARWTVAWGIGAWVGMIAAACSSAIPDVTTGAVPVRPDAGTTARPDAGAAGIKDGGGGFAPEAAPVRDAGLQDDARDDSDSASTPIMGPASISGSVGGYSIAPAYSYGGYSGDLFVFVTNNDSTECWPADRRTLAYQATGAPVDDGSDGGSLTWSTANGGLIVSFAVTEGCATAVHELGEGTLTIPSGATVSMIPIQGSLTAAFEGGTFVGTFTAARDFPVQCVVPCEGGSCVVTCDGG